MALVLSLLAFNLSAGAYLIFVIFCTAAIWGREILCLKVRLFAKKLCVEQFFSFQLEKFYPCDGSDKKKLCPSSVPLIFGYQRLQCHLNSKHQHLFVTGPLCQHKTWIRVVSLSVSRFQSATISIVIAASSFMSESSASLTNNSNNKNSISFLDVIELFWAIGHNVIHSLLNFLTCE